MFLVANYIHNVVGEYNQNYFSHFYLICMLFLLIGFAHYEIILFRFTTVTALTMGYCVKYIH